MKDCIIQLTTVSVSPPKVLIKEGMSRLPETQSSTKNSVRYLMWERLCTPDFFFLSGLTPLAFPNRGFTMQAMLKAESFYVVEFASLVLQHAFRGAYFKQ